MFCGPFPWNQAILFLSSYICILCTALAPAFPWYSEDSCALPRSKIFSTPKGSNTSRRHDLNLPETQFSDLKSLKWNGGIFRNRTYSYIHFQKPYILIYTFLCLINSTPSPSLPPPSIFCSPSHYTFIHNNILSLPLILLLFYLPPTLPRCLSSGRPFPLILSFLVCFPSHYILSFTLFLLPSLFPPMSLSASPTLYGIWINLLVFPAVLCLTICLSVYVPVCLLVRQCVHSVYLLSIYLFVSLSVYNFIYLL